MEKGQRKEGLWNLRDRGSGKGKIIQNVNKEYREKKKKK